MMIDQNTPASVTFLDLQATLGVTKHIGGFEATNELLTLCHIENAREVLNVGCGIGVGSSYVARKYGCRVVGIDISDKMIEWSRKRAREERVEDRVDFQTADVLDMSFESDRFDVVFAESVLVFIEDKARAIQECIRVAKPGGYVGLSEGFWIEQPSPDVVTLVQDAVGPCVPTIETWQALWEASGLQERVVQTRSIDPGAEIKSRIHWIGWGWLVRAWGRALRLAITNPGIRQSIKKQFDVPPEALRCLGYGLFVGKKQE